MFDTKDVQVLPANLEELGILADGDVLGGVNGLTDDCEKADNCCDTGSSVIARDCLKNALSANGV